MSYAKLSTMAWMTHPSITTTLQKSDDVTRSYIS